MRYASRASLREKSGMSRAGPRAPLLEGSAAEKGMATQRVLSGSFPAAAAACCLSCSSSAAAALRRKRRRSPRRTPGAAPLVLRLQMRMQAKPCPHGSDSRARARLASGRERGGNEKCSRCTAILRLPLKQEAGPGTRERGMRKRCSELLVLWRVGSCWEQLLRSFLKVVEGSASPPALRLLRLLRSVSPPLALRCRPLLRGC
jgi:hypothetical protein